MLVRFVTFTMRSTDTYIIFDNIPSDIKGHSDECVRGELEEADAARKDSPSNT